MSWLELDDGILRHPKFIRAFRIAGSEAIHLWLGLRAYCGQLLTDGEIPSDMVDVVDGPAKGKARAAALSALIHVGLLDSTPGGFRMHDYLDWSSSKVEVESRRASNRDRKRRSRGTADGVTGESQRSHSVTTQGIRAESQTPARADPLPSPPIPSPPHQIGSDPEPSPFRMPPHRMARVGAATIPFLAVYDRYPNKDSKNAAADAFQVVAESYPGGEASLRDAILAWFDSGALKRHPYSGEPRFRPKLEKVVVERRWEDDQSVPNDDASTAAKSGPHYPKFADLPAGVPRPR